jgi:hypothetical protein
MIRGMAIASPVLRASASPDSEAPVRTHGPSRMSWQRPEMEASPASTVSSRPALDVSPLAKALVQQESWAQKEATKDVAKTMNTGVMYAEDSQPMADAKIKAYQDGCVANAKEKLLTATRADLSKRVASMNLTEAPEPSASSHQVSKEQGIPPKIVETLSHRLGEKPERIGDLVEQGFLAHLPGSMTKSPDGKVVNINAVVKGTAGRKLTLPG